MSDEDIAAPTEGENGAPNRSVAITCGLIALGTSLAVIVGALGGPLGIPWLLLAPIALILVALLYASLATRASDGDIREATFAATLAGSLVVGATASAVVAVSQPTDLNQHWLILVPAGVWLATSIIATATRRSHDEGKASEGFWHWVLGHKTIAGSIAIVYLSAAGLVHEIQFYSHLELDALHYVDPGTVAYATLSHWQLGLSAALGALAALGLMMWLWHRLGTRPQHGGRLLEHLRARRWIYVALWFLALPARSVGLVRTLIVIVGAFAFILVPLAIAAHRADLAYEEIKNHASGTLGLSRPSRVATGVKHVASTSAHMVLVYPCIPDRENPQGAEKNTKKETKPSSTWRDILAEAYRTVSNALLGTQLSKPSPPSTHTWLPIIVPWSSVASFDLQMDSPTPTASPPGSRRTAVPNQQQGVPDANNDDASQHGCKPWKPTSPGSAVGPPGPKGDSVDIQYSKEGAVDGTWFDKPTQDVRYVRFRIGEGDWEPAEGIRIAGSRELWYPVSFDRFRLADGIAAQLRIDKAIPRFASQGTGCQMEVTGCASQTPFLYACAEEGGSTCTRCTPGGGCHAVLTRLGEAGDVASYLPAEFLLKHLEENHALQCPEDLLQCVEKVNGLMNCGAANLRALATAAKLASVTLESAFDDNDLRLESDNDEHGPVLAAASTLVLACGNVGRGNSFAMATLHPANASYGSSQCWRPPESRLNHAAIIRSIGDEKGTFDGCLPSDPSRYATQ